MTLFSHWVSLKEIAYFGIALAGVIAAFQGLSAWKKQLRGRAEYDAARKLYKAILQLRDAISFVRKPFIPQSETIKAVNQFKKENPEATINENAAVYQLRWNKIIEAISAVQLESLEAEVLWGDEVGKIIKPLNQCVGKLNSHLAMFLNPQLYGSSTRDFNSIIYEVVSDTEKDEFTIEIEHEVQQVAESTSAVPTNF